MADCMAMTNFGEDMNAVNFVVPSKLGAGSYKKEDESGGALTELGVRVGITGLLLATLFSTTREQARTAF